MDELVVELGRFDLSITFEFLTDFDFLIADFDFLTADFDFLLVDLEMVWVVGSVADLPAAM